MSGRKESRSVCGCCSYKEPEAEKDPAPPLSPKEGDRRCTDILCLLLFIIFFAGMIGLAGLALQNGDYKRVLNGVDYRGCICGTPSKLMNDGSCTEVEKGSAGSFVPGGSSMFGVPLAVPSSPDLSASTVVVCAPACPAAPVSSGPFEGVQLACYDNSSQTVFGTGATYSEQLDSLDSCPGTIFATTAPARSIAGYCLPKSAVNSNMTGLQMAVDKAVGAGTWASAVASLSQAWPAMLGLGFGALLISFVYLYFVQFCAGILTAVAIIGFGASLIAGGAFFILKANAIADSYDNVADSYSQDTNWQMSFYGGIALEVVAALYICIIVFMWRRIFLAVGLIQHAGKALRDVWGVVFLPVFFVPLTLAIAALWCATTVLLFSLGEIKSVDVPGVPSGTLRTFVVDDTIRYTLFVHLFGLFWATQFVQAFSELVIAFATTHWFFSPTVDGKRQIIPNTTLFACRTVLRYHVGTAAFGSAIIAIIRTLRAIFVYIYDKIRRGNKDSTFLRAVGCLCWCCFWCLDCCMRYVNRNAYVMVALSKQSFCPSTVMAFSYIARNFLRVGALTGMSTVFLFIGKLFVAGITTAIGFAVFTMVPMYADETSADYVASPFWPCLVIFGVSYTIGSLFMSVYAIAIDAMLMCYLYNEDWGFVDSESSAAIADLNSKASKEGSSSGAEYRDRGSDEVGERVPVAASDGRPTYS
ncbi:hypothetical protein FNF27_01969 [Cafeteria roenbergensis]|uniref:Choline transporter-like protein n=1 Tax=Cafeteria roenbergensis TaxID=33653 RepID=A0A5A8E0Y4_CAFRO|nr:hypothetical protein FNF31_00050 [Cafeteria roenbergensis]KAA0170584.1 hypothetical protein FNF28_01346 [Cafeteria roenbergensis]KAA0176688.1 hypothetical protein FNF27_01969 [Cafeteria roenbergensis]